MTDAARFAGCRKASEFLAVWLERQLLDDADQAALETYYRNFRRLKSARMRHWYDEQIREAEEIVRARPGLRLLEVGFGFGTESLWLASLGARVTGIDVADVCVRVANARLEILRRALDRPLDCNLTYQPLLDFEAAPFDVLWMEQALHHLEPREAMLDKIAGLVRPGGHLVISEANALNPLLQAQLFRIRGTGTVVPMTTDRGDEILYGYERIMTERTLSAHFARRGFRRLKRRYFRMLPSHPAFDALYGLERRASSPLLAPLYTHFNYVGEKV